jgi:Protein of unknown function (DUF2510)
MEAQSPRSPDDQTVAASSPPSAEPVVAKQYSPPEWFFHPATAWIWLVGGIILIFTPLFPLNWLISIVAAVLVYQDLKNRRLPTTGWVIAILLFASLALIFYNHRRPPASVRGAPTSALPPPPPQPLPPANWYPDPWAQARLRYWDGSRWTEHTSQ